MVNADSVSEHVIRHLKWDASHSASEISVDYVDRKAILTGTVPSITAHYNAQRDAQSIPGVDRVENRLFVKLKHDHPNKPDRDLLTGVRTVLKCTVGSDSSPIEVSVLDGIVTLVGTTDSYWQKARLGDIASSVDGVLDIKNQLKVTPSGKTPDNTIKNEIIDALGRMEVSGLDKVNVKVENGVVNLEGSVPTWSTSFDIEDTARYTTGVVDVENILSVD